jgi:hypothetical protein
LVIRSVRARGIFVSVKFTGIGGELLPIPASVTEGRFARSKWPIRFLIWLDQGSWRIGSRIEVWLLVKAGIDRHFLADDGKVYSHLSG